jgi:hypothetical protein
MKKFGIFLAVMIIAASLAGCASSDAARTNEPVQPPPPGTERLLLENGAYAIFKFELPDGAKWADYNKITVEYMVDEDNIKKRQRNDNNVRLMGNYSEEKFELAGSFRNFNLGDGPSSSNGPYIMDNTPRTFKNMDAVPNEWFTVTYDISGTKGHAQFQKANIPAPDAKGPFFFGIGIPGMDAGRFGGITQLVRNVTLHHAVNPALNVVSKGSGFEEPAFVSFYPALSKRESGGPAE